MREKECIEENPIHRDRYILRTIEPVCRRGKVQLESRDLSYKTCWDFLQQGNGKSKPRPRRMAKGKMINAKQTGWEQVAGGVHQGRGVEKGVEEKTYLGSSPEISTAAEARPARGCQGLTMMKPFSSICALRTSKRQRSNNEFCIQSRGLTSWGELRKRVEGLVVFMGVWLFHRLPNYFPFFSMLRRRSNVNDQTKGARGNVWFGSSIGMGKYWKNQLEFVLWTSNHSHKQNNFKWVGL